MNTMRRLLIIFSLLLTLMPLMAQNQTPDAILADSAYNARDFNAAVRLYHQAIYNEGPTAIIYYNLGNSYYRIGKLGRAVIYYERALALDPSLKDARTNLDFVNTQILDKPEDDSSFLGNLHESIVSSMSVNAWAWSAFSLFVLMIGCIAIYIFTDSITLRKVGFFGSIILFFVWIYFLICAWTASHRIDNHDTAVVIIPTANLTTSPGAAAKGDKVIPIHEGTRLEIIDSLNIKSDGSDHLWYDVKVNNSTRAWIRAADVEKI